MPLDHLFFMTMSAILLISMIGVPYFLLNTMVQWTLNKQQISFGSAALTNATSLFISLTTFVGYTRYYDDFFWLVTWLILVTITTQVIMLNLLSDLPLKKIMSTVVLSNTISCTVSYVYGQYGFRPLRDLLFF